MEDKNGTIEMLKSEVKKYQCEQRYLHTLSVYGECKKLADIFSLTEEEKEKLMREAVEKEVQRLKMQENEKKETNSFESGKDNEG